jgi:hypothetical protein
MPNGSLANPFKDKYPKYLSFSMTVLLLALTFFLSMTIALQGENIQKATERLGQRKTNDTSIIITQTKNWKIYRNTTYKLEFKYPPDLTYKEEGSNIFQRKSNEGEQVSGTVEPSLRKVVFKNEREETQFTLEIYNSNLDAISEKDYLDNYLYTRGDCDVRWGFNIRSSEIIEYPDLRVLKVTGTNPKSQSCYYINNSSGNLFVFSTVDTGNQKLFNSLENILHQILSTFQFLETPVRLNLEVKKLETGYGIDELPPHNYPQSVEISISKKFTNDVQAYGVGNKVIIAPKNWTGRGSVGADGGTFIQLWPENGNENNPIITITEIPACVGCILGEAAIYFPEAERSYLESFPAPINKPSNLKTEKVDKQLVKFSLGKNPSMPEAIGAAYYNDNPLFFLREEIKLSGIDGKLADELINLTVSPLEN